MSLSDKIIPCYCGCGQQDIMLATENVKEFIGEILMCLTCIDKPLKRKDLYDFICQRAGPKLIIK